MSAIRLSRNFKVPVIQRSEQNKDKIYYRWDPASKRLVQAIPPSIPIVDNYSWMLIDNTNEVWKADADFSNLRSSGYQIPLGSNYWQYGSPYIQKCLWTGTYWLFTNRVTSRLLRSDVNLRSWEVVDGVFRTQFHDLATDGDSRVILLNSGNAGNNSYISYDKGQTWPTAFIFPPNFISDNQHKVYYDRNLLMGLVSIEIKRSTDNSVTFQTVLTKTGDTDQILCFCRLPNGTFYATGRNRYWTSSDNGLTWTQNNIGTGVLYNLIGEILYDGSKYVGVGLYDGPIWSNDGVNWTKWTSSDGSVLNGFDYDYHRLHFNGTSYAFRNGTNNILHTSSDGKIWSRLAHPIAGRSFIDSYPKAQDTNLNIK